MPRPPSAANLLAQTNAARAIVGAPPLKLGGLALELHRQLAAARSTAAHQQAQLYEARLALSDYTSGAAEGYVRELAELLADGAPQFRVVLDEAQGGLRRATVRVVGAEAGFVIDSHSQTWQAEPAATEAGWKAAAHFPSLQLRLRKELEAQLTDVLLEVEPEFFGPAVVLCKTYHANLWLLAAGANPPRLRLEHREDDEAIYARRNEPEQVAKFFAAMVRDSSEWRLHLRVRAGIALLNAALQAAGLNLGAAWEAAIRQAEQFAAACTLEIIRVTLPPALAAQEAELREALSRRGVRLGLEPAGRWSGFGATYPDGLAVEEPLLDYIRQLVCDALAEIGWGPN